MKTINDLKEITNLAENQLKTLNSIIKDEIKENSKPKENTIKLFNALLFSISNAYDIIDKGLNGKF